MVWREGELGGGVKSARPGIIRIQYESMDVV